jgi:hypothetical protein
LTDAYYQRGLAKRDKGDTVGGAADIDTAKRIDPSVGK